MKGISPLIASVLLIAFTLAVATIIGSWLTSVSKTSTQQIGGQLTQQVNCTGNVLDIVDALCHDNTVVTITLQNMGDAALTSPSFYIRAQNQTYSCTNSSTDTIAAGGISKFDIPCTNFPVNMTINYVRVTALCSGTVPVYTEKSDFTDACSS